MRNRSLLPRVAERPLCLKSSVLIKLGRNSDLQGFHVFIFGVAGDLLECVPGSQDTKEIRLRPPSPYCHTARQHVKGLWEDTCVALLNPSSSPLFVPWMSSHTPRGKKAAVDSDIPKGQNLQGLEVQKRQRLPERVVQIHPTALGWSPLLRDPSLP